MSLRVGYELGKSLQAQAKIAYGDLLASHRPSPNYKIQIDSCVFRLLNQIVDKCVCLLAVLETISIIVKNVFCLGGFGKNKQRPWATACLISNGVVCMHLTRLLTSIGQGLVYLLSAVRLSLVEFCPLGLSL